MEYKERLENLKELLSSETFKENIVYEYLKDVRKIVDSFSKKYDTDFKDRGPQQPGVLHSSIFGKIEVYPMDAYSGRDSGKIYVRVGTQISDNPSKIADDIYNILKKSRVGKKADYIKRDSGSAGQFIKLYF